MRLFGRRRVWSWLSSDAGHSVLVFLWPFVYLHNYIIPFKWTWVEVANDFYRLYYAYKVHLIASLAAGEFPLWSPAEGAGFPFYSSPFTQTFYPLNVLPWAWYELAGGYGRYEHQLFTILGLALFALGLHRWLRAMGISPRAALLSALVLGVSFKVTEILASPTRSTRLAGIRGSCW